LARWRERVGMTLPEARAARRFFLKRYHQPPLRQQLRRLLAGYASTAAVEWHWLHLIGGLGIAVPTPVAYGASLAGWKERGSLLLTEEVPGESLDNWIPAAVRRGGLGRRVRGVLVERTAQLVARLHHADVVHRDLYLAHLFVHAAGDGDYELTLIDLQRVLAPRWRRRRWIVKDLASLNYSTPFAAAGRTDRLRFMLRYLSEDRLSRRSKELIRAIVRKTERIARHSSKHELG
jgi:heptose I phosphotransferase